MSESIVILGAARTPMGSFQGDFASLAAHDLGGAAIRAAVERAGVAPDSVGEVLMGNCLMAGQGQAPARQAAFKGGLPQSAGAVTLSKMCGSGLKAAMLAHDMLLAGSFDVMVAGGMESMTNAPYLLQKGRSGYRMGHDKIFDHMMLDGLEDASEPGRSMGTTAKASLISHRSTSCTLQPVLASSFCTAPTGAVANQLGAWAWVLWPTMRASGWAPSGLAVLARARTRAAAPSLMDELLAAVMVPSFLKAGLRLGILSSLTLPGPSSTDTTVSPARVLTVTGVISLAKAPDAVAALARSTLAMAKASCCSRVKLYLAAQSSPKVPLERPGS